MACNVTGWRSAGNSVPSRPVTEVDNLINVQFIDIADCIRSAGTKAKTKNQKLTNVFRPARIFANLVLAACALCLLNSLMDKEA